IKILSTTSRNVIATIDNEGKLGQIEWSPDGQWLAIRGAKDINDPIDGRILTVSAEGGKPQKIDVGFKGKYENISWTGGNTIHFLASEGTSSVLGTIKPDGTGKQIVFKSDAHHITSFSRGKSGMISFTANSPQHPTELFTIAATRNAQPVKRTDNNPWLKEIRLGKQEVITYKT